jgi:MFS family permease
MNGGGRAGETVGRARIGRNVVVLGGVSLLTDVSTEMAYPLLPIFLTVVLHSSATALGAIEGLAESVAALLKLASGWISDRAPGRKPLVVAGYGLASAVKPLLGLAQSVGQVAAIRVADRVGKGIRSSPRDALIADSVAPSLRGKAFGFHRAMDNLGAVIGPLVAFAILRHGPGASLRQVFLWSAVPAALSVALLVAGVREVRGAGGATRPGPAAAEAAAAARDSAPDSAPGQRQAPPLGGRFWGLFAILAVFTLGNSSDTFLLLRATQVGVAAVLVPVLWALLNLVKAIFNVPGGALSDRFGRRPLLAAGWLIYGCVYLGFGFATAAWQMWALFAAYGLYFGATEGVQSALVADAVPAERRGTAYGFYNLAIGIAALPASLIFGFLLDRAGARTAFTFGAAMALAAAVAICFVAPSPAARRPPGRDG